KAIEIKPDYAWAWVQLGQLLHEELKRYDEAEQAYRKAIEIKPDYAWAWGQLGSLYQELKRYDEAEQAYRKAVENSYEIKVLHNFALAQLGGFYEEIGKYKEAEETYLKAISLTSDSSAGWSALIKLILEHDITPDRAMEVAKDALVRNPDNPTFLNSFAWRFYKHGNLTHLREAEKWARKAQTIEPDDANIQHTLACILCVLNKGSEALVNAQKYLSDTALVAEHADDTIELFIGLAAVGYAREAKEMLQKSLAEKSIEPLIVGLSLYIGENVKAAAEVMEVANDVVKRIKERQEKLKN
ncbi:MAG: tetratricopeptide repeat protein, partial [Thermodesulfovibrionales bacterium]